MKEVGKTIKGWAKIRAVVLDRDNHACRVCRKDGGEAKLNVHHVDHERSHNAIDNLVTLCSVCHRAVHAERYMPALYEDWPIPWGKHPPLGGWQE